MSLHTGSLCNLTVGDTCQFRFSLPSHADIQLLGTILERKLKLYPMGNRLLEDILKRGCHLIEGSRFAAVNKFGLFKLSLEASPKSKEGEAGYWKDGYWFLVLTLPPRFKYVEGIQICKAITQACKDGFREILRKSY